MIWMVAPRWRGCVAIVLVFKWKYNLLYHSSSRLHLSINEQLLNCCVHSITLTTEDEREGFLLSGAGNLSETRCAHGSTVSVGDEEGTERPKPLRKGLDGVGSHGIMRSES